MDSTKVVLCLYAPKKNNCFVLGDFNNWQEDSIHYMKMTPDSNRFWIKVENLVPGTEYIFQYLVDGSIRIADPYCDKVSDPDDQDISPSTYPGLLHYPSDKTKEIASYLQTSQLPFSWNENLFIPPDITDLVIYELLIRDFIGDHDYPTLIDTLPYLKKLGINAVELMPVMEFEGNSSWGYNPDFMFAPDKYYGTKNGLKQFIEAAHSNGIAVILDIVLNHQFGKSPLVRLYWDGQSNTVAANSPWFNQIPMHPYNVGFDFNHESPDTRAFCKRVFQYWLTEYHVDGFRLDMSKGFTQKNSYPDNVGLWGQYDASRINILQDYQSAIRAVKPNAYVILEHFADNSEEKVLSASGMMLWGNMNYSYNEATMGWNSGSGSDFSGISYRERGWSNTNLVGYMESHDEERLMFKNISYGNSQATYNVKDTVTALDRIQLGATFFFTVPGPKMIYEFEETGFDYSINSNGGRLAPKPIRWDYQSWWPRKYLFNVFSSLINLKKNLPVFKASDFSLDVSGPLKKIHLQSAGMNAAILGNFDVVQQSITPAFQQSGTWYDYFSGDSISVINTTDNLTFQPGEYHIYTTVKLNKPLFTGMDETLLPFSTGKDISVVYPNPSSNHFNIVVKINKPSGIFIDFYNWSGEKIFRITENSCNIGTHLITWDGSNFEGKRVPSGIYLYRVTVENKSEIKKLILE